MIINKFDQYESYEWVGKFWFPDQEDNKYFGRMTYTPESGIKLKLLNHPKTINPDDHFHTKKRMFAVLDGDERGAMTLMNVFLTGGPITTSPTTMYHKGSAQFALAWPYVDGIEFDKIAVSYDDHLNNVFCPPPKGMRSYLAFAKGKIINAPNEFSISADVNTSGTFILSNDAIDEAIWTLDENASAELKAALQPVFDKHPNAFVNRKKTEFEFIFSRNETDVGLFIDEERKWRAFWELAIDHPISIKHAWVYVNFPDDEGNKRLIRTPLLASAFKPPKRQGSPIGYPMLPLNFDALGGNNFDISTIQDIICNWLNINQETKWQPVIDGLNRVLSSRDELIDGSRFVSLCSEIETFLDLMGEEKANPDRMIELYASDEWNEQFAEIAENKPSSQTFGKWIAKIRNSITHPKTAKMDGNGKYWAIASDPFKLQKVYAFLGGLLIKAVLLSIGINNKAAIDNYIENFIRTRASIFPTEYK